MSPIELTIFGSLLAACFGLAGWALKSVVELHRLHAGLEAKTEARHEATHQRFEDVRKDQAREYATLNSGLDEVKKGMTKLHERLDDLADRDR